MATVVLMLFAGPGTVIDGQTDGQSGDYMLPPYLIIIIIVIMTVILISLQQC